MAFISKPTRGNLTGFVEAVETLPDGYGTEAKAFVAYMEEHSEEWSDEHSNRFTTMEFLTSIDQAIFDRSRAADYSVLLERYGFKVFKSGVEIVAASHDDTSYSWTVAVPYAASVPAGLDGWTAEADGSYSNGGFRHLDLGIKHIARTDMNVRQFVLAFRNGSDTFRSNYDNSYVTPPELFQAMLQFKNPEYRNSMTDGVLLFERRVLGEWRKVLGITFTDSGIFNTIIAYPSLNAVPTGWTLAE